MAARLQSGMQAWTNALNGTKKEIDLSMDTDAPAQPTHKPGGDPQVRNLSPKCVWEKIKAFVVRFADVNFISL